MGEFQCKHSRTGGCVCPPGPPDLRGPLPRASPSRSSGWRRQASGGRPDDATASILGRRGLRGGAGGGARRAAGAAIGTRASSPPRDAAGIQRPRPCGRGRRRQAPASVAALDPTPAPTWDRAEPSGAPPLFPSDDDPLPSTPSRASLDTRFPQRPSDLPTQLPALCGSRGPKPFHCKCQVQCPGVHTRVRSRSWGGQKASGAESGAGRRPQRRHCRRHCSRAGYGPPEFTRERRGCAERAIQVQRTACAKAQRCVGAPLWQQAGNVRRVQKRGRFGEGGDVKGLDARRQVELGAKEGRWPESQLPSCKKSYGEVHVTRN
nr:uncharacterized protein LOC106781495 [Equus caballus]